MRNLLISFIISLGALVSLEASVPLSVDLENGTWHDISCAIDPVWRDGDYAAGPEILELAAVLTASDEAWKWWEAEQAAQILRRYAMDSVPGNIQALAPYPTDTSWQAEYEYARAAWDAVLLNGAPSANDLHLWQYLLAGGR